MKVLSFIVIMTVDLKKKLITLHSSLKKVGLKFIDAILSLSKLYN